MIQIEDAAGFCQSLSCKGLELRYVFTDGFDWSALQHLTQNIDLLAQQKIVAFKYKRDKLNCLWGRILLHKALRDMAIQQDIKELQYSVLGKPILPGIQFSISHASSLVILSASKDIVNGIDCEEIKPIETTDFRSYFCAREWSYIESGEDHLKRFYQLWTRKEALLKALGCGLQTQLDQINVLFSELHYANSVWSFAELDFHPEYVVSLCYGI